MEYMKGAGNIPMSIVIMLIAMLLTTVIFISTVVQFHEYQITTQNRKELRLMIDVAENILGDECLVKERGVFDSQKLDAGKVCVSIPVKYSVSVEEITGKKWGLFIPLSLQGPTGAVGPQGEMRSLYFPCNVYYSDKTVACKMLIEMI